MVTMDQALGRTVQARYLLVGVLQTPWETAVRSRQPAGLGSFTCQPYDQPSRIDKVKVVMPTSWEDRGFNGMMSTKGI